MNRPTFLEGAQVSVRAALAASLALVLAEGFQLEYPIYAFLAAVLVTDLSSAQTRRLGWRRLVATVAGATCGATLSQLLPHGPWAIGLGVVITMLLCNLVRMSEGAKVGGYICGIVQLTYSLEPWSYAYYRVVETLLGIGVAWGISLVPILVRLDESERTVP